MKTRYSSLIVFLLLCFVLAAACSQPSSSSNNVPGGTVSEESIVMKIGHTLPTTHPRHKVLEAFEKQVEEQTNGKLMLEIYPANQIGDNNQLLQSVPIGTIQAAIQPTAFFGGVQNKLNVIDLPYIWRDLDHAAEVASSELADQIMEPLEEVGLKGIGLWPLGVNVLTSNKPLDNFEDLQGQKFRTMGTPVQIDTFNSWGTNPTPIPVPELYTSLQQGVVDGQFNDVGTIYDLKVHEVQDYMSITNHSIVIDVFYVNKDWFYNLPEEYQTILTDTGKELSLMIVDEVKKVFDDKLAKIKETDMQISNPSDEMLGKLKDHSHGVIDNFINEYPDLQGILDEITK